MWVPREVNKLDKPCVLKVPQEPTEEVVMRHRSMGHPHFEAWCPHCVRGRAKSNPRAKVERVYRVPMMCADYMTMGERPDEVSGEREKGHTDQDGGSTC